MIKFLKFMSTSAIFFSEGSYIVTMNNIIVKKFGGTSLTDLTRVANLIKKMLIKVIE